MRFLVVGSGGREHAIVRALKYSPMVTEVHAVPGSEGISQEAICHSFDLSDERTLEAFVKKYAFDCVVIGPEAYLVQGLADQLRGYGVTVVGPSLAAAQLEGSKIFAKEFMLGAGVPTAAHVVVEDVVGTMKAAQKFTAPYVLKADGLAAGKGVYVCATLSELKTAAEFLFVDKGLGQAGRKALLEEFQEGYELSYLVLTNGAQAEALPLAQDHKRVGDGDQGPNTGGMGVICPIVISPELQAQIQTQIVEPTLRHLQGSGMLYRGVLYIGLMVTPKGPTVIEYNVRFGDPECQVILPLLDGDWAAVFKKLGAGDLQRLRWKSLHVSCVVLAAPGYPDAPEKGVVLEGDLGRQSATSYFLHAGTAKNSRGEWVTAGGRVLNCIGYGSNLRESLQAAYAQARQVTWKGLVMRTDIGAKVLP
jgi:phosphoribosylamine--glycine ligase